MPTTQQYANLHAVVPAAQASFRKWGVPASVTLAQWIPESSWGFSQLAVEAHNYFGIKCAHLDGSEPYVEMPTAEYERGQRVMEMADFAKYPDEMGSFDDHGRLLASALRYRPAMAIAANPLGFALQLQRCGYSTCPTYGPELQGFIRMYNLTQYDLHPSAQPAAKSAA